LEWVEPLPEGLNGSPLIRRGANVTIKRQYGYRMGVLAFCWQSANPPN
jgi:hypothetical protein